KYFEDVDYARRVARSGWRVLFHGETYAYHWEQRKSRVLFSREALRHLRAYARWLWKWRGAGPVVPQRRFDVENGAAPPRAMLELPEPATETHAEVAPVAGKARAAQKTGIKKWAAR